MTTKTTTAPVTTPANDADMLPVPTLSQETLKRDCEAYARFYFKTFDFKNKSRECVDIWKATQEAWMEDILDHDSSWHFEFEGQGKNPSQFLEYMDTKATNAKRTAYMKALRKAVR